VDAVDHFLGLLQIVFVLVISFIMIDKQFTMDYFLNNCTLLFFSTAVLASLMIESLINNRILNVYFSFLFPLVLIIVCSIVYTCYYNSMGPSLIEGNLFCDCLNTEKIDLKNLQTIQYVVFGLAIFFMIVCKTYDHYISNQEE
jgi:hypothetical protein